MGNLRIILASLLVVPAVLFPLCTIFHGPDWPENSTLGEMVFLVFGLPILVLNYCAWVDPDLIENLFFKGLYG